MAENEAMIPFESGKCLFIALYLVAKSDFRMLLAEK